MSEKTPQEEAILEAARAVVDLELRVFAPIAIDQPSPSTPAHAELVQARLVLRNAVLAEQGKSRTTAVSRATGARYSKREHDLARERHALKQRGPL